MTLYLNLRQLTVGGSVLDQPYMLQGAAATNINSLTSVPWANIPQLVGGRNLLFIVHGFNVNFAAGARMNDRIGPLLNLAAGDVAIGVLWPGDSFIPVVDYPFEGNVAIAAGKAIATFCRTYLVSARSFSFASHSLGARVVLQALLGLGRPARSVTLMAGAINQSCLTREYAAAARNTETLSVLASKGDNVLKLAFPIGDPFADLLHDDHPVFEPALGYAGPSTSEAALVEGPWQIPLSAPPSHIDYDHGSYLPPSDAVESPPATNPPSYIPVASYIANAFYGRPQSWPGTVPLLQRGFNYHRYLTG
jgi:Alpha/beta hydrolase of unknown function (DUF900)